MKKNLLVCYVILLLIPIPTFAQQEDSLAQLLNLSIERLMDIPIYSASKTEESTFDAPMSSSVVTKEQIKNAGCTSIIEALRLAPGLIVREQTNGNYDVHIRGLDNIPPNTNLAFFANSTTLVMIDNRPVYNYLHGGTFWETLPISLNDVEQIEVVRGPCSALYGPNAASGVINFITRKPEKDGLYAVANAAYGSYKSLITNASLGYKFNKKVSAIISANYITRDRVQDTYYDPVQNKFVPIDSVTAVKTNPLHNTSQSYPDPSLAFRKKCINGFLNFDPRKNIHVSVALGAQNSDVQKEFATGLTNITTSLSKTQYASISANIHDLTIQASHLTGEEEPSLGQKIWHWNLNTTDAIVEYNYSKIKNLELRPGVSFRQAEYDDRDYVNTAIKEGLWNGVATSQTRAVSLRADYMWPGRKLRLIGAGRLDDFNYPSKNYFSYQLLATYKLNDYNILRFSQAKANRTPLLIDLYTNIDQTGPFPITNPSQTYLLQIRGNQQLKLLTSSMWGAGCRSKLNEHLETDIEVFYVRSKDFSDVVFENYIIDSTGPVSLKALIDLNNLTIHTERYGATLTVEYSNGQWQLKPFITFQKTYLLDYSPYENSPNSLPTAMNKFDPAHNNLYSGLGTRIEHEGTPDFFGGAYINYHPLEKLNLNINSYFYTDHTQLEASNLTYHDGSRGVQIIKAKVLINFVVSYNVTKQITVSVNLRNILNDRSREFYKGDETAFMAFGWVNFEF